MERRFYRQLYRFTLLNCSAHDMTPLLIILSELVIIFDSRQDRGFRIKMDSLRSAYTYLIAYFHHHTSFVQDLKHTGQRNLSQVKLNLPCLDPGQSRST